MRRLLALLQKELWDHGLVLVGVGLSLLGIGAVLLLGTAVGPRTITVLEAHAMFVRVFLPLLGLALGHRLIVREYHGRTQRFLEALPLRRVEMLSVKYGIGLALVAGAAVASLIAVGAVAAIREPITARWMAVVLVRSVAFALALWSFFFAMGMLGRWRVPLYLGLAVAALVIETSTDVEVARFGPFALVAETFVLERRDVPWGDLGVTLLLALCLTGVGAALALVREGSVAESMAKAMSRRDKAAVGLAFVAAILVLEVADPRRAEAPFAFEREEVVTREAAELSVLYLEPRHAPAAEALADALADDLVGLREALGFEAFVPVHVALRETLAPHELEQIELGGEGEEARRDGVLVHARFTDEAFDPEAFRAFVLARVLEASTDGRAGFEPNAWVRDAVAGWWVSRGRPPARVLAPAHFLARDAEPAWSTLARWQTIEERFGEAAARASATTAAHAVVERAGEERWLRFARAVLEPEPWWGVAAVIDARLHPVGERFEEATSIAPAALGEVWSQWLAAHPPPTPLPRVGGWLRIDSDEDALRVVSWGVDGPLDEGAICALVHAPLGPFDVPVEPDASVREEAACASLGGEGGVLVGRYGPGERAFFAIEVGADADGPPLRVLAERRTIE